MLEPSAVVDGYKIWVIDNFLETHEHDAVFGYCVNSLYSPRHVSDWKTAGNHKRMTSILSEDDVKHLPLTEAFISTAFECVGVQLAIKNAYINFYDLSTRCADHVDSDKEGVTMLYYPNTVWDINWGGDTIFFNKNKEAAFVSVYKPNRVIFFDPRLLHTARPPTIMADHARFTVAYKGEK